MARGFDVAVMHDFFVDRLVHVKGIPALTRDLRSKRLEGGGGFHGVRQSEIRGGNAVNLANALGRLGLRTLLITHSEKEHLGLLRGAFEDMDVEIRAKNKPAGLTVAIEEEVNVMLGDARGARDFGTEELGAEDWASLKKSKVVCTVNWAGNLKGTELALGLRDRLGKDARILMDPADFRDRTAKFRIMLKAVEAGRGPDWLSMNEQESAAAAELLGVHGRDLKSTCLGLAKKLRVRFDLHAERASFTSDGEKVAGDRTALTKPRRLTGAGDVWDAGSVYGTISGMEDQERMRFANTASRLYLEAVDPVPPSLEQVLGELE